MPNKIVCRVCTTDGVGEGIWYDKDGNPKNDGLPAVKCYHAPQFAMPYSSDHCGFISVADSLADLMFWFNPTDIRALERMGYFITLFEAENVKQYEYAPGKFNTVAQKKGMVRLGIVKIEDYLKNAQ